MSRSRLNYKLISLKKQESSLLGPSLVRCISAYTLSVHTCTFSFSLSFLLVSLFQSKHLVGVNAATVGWSY